MLISNATDLNSIDPAADTFDRLKKVKIDGVQAIVCGKNKDTTPEYAIGYTTGQIKILDLSSKGAAKIEFPGGEWQSPYVVSLTIVSL